MLPWSVRGNYVTAERTCIYIWFRSRLPFFVTRRNNLKEGCVRRHRQSHIAQSHHYPTNAEKGRKYCLGTQYGCSYNVRTPWNHFRNGGFSKEKERQIFCCVFRHLCSYSATCLRTDQKSDSPLWDAATGTRVPTKLLNQAKQFNKTDI